jgi:hypothetical protein
MFFPMEKNVIQMRVENIGDHFDEIDSTKTSLSIDIL